MFTARHYRLEINGELHMDTVAQLDPVAKSCRLRNFWRVMDNIGFQPQSTAITKQQPSFGVVECLNRSRAR